MSELPLQASSKERNHSLREQEQIGQTPRLQGQIITQNPELLNLLRENSQSSLTDTKPNSTDRQLNLTDSQTILTDKKLSLSDKQPNVTDTKSSLTYRKGFTDTEYSSTDTKYSSTDRKQSLTETKSDLVDKQYRKADDCNNNKTKSEDHDVNKESSKKSTTSSDLDAEETAKSYEPSLKDSLEVDDNTGEEVDPNEDQPDTEEDTKATDTGINFNQNNNQNRENSSGDQNKSQEPSEEALSIRKKTSHVESFINPDILSASGLDPLDNKYFFPKYVSLKTALQSFDSDNSKKKSESGSQSAEQTDRSTNRQKEPSSTAGDPFTGKPDYPSFEKGVNQSSENSQRETSNPDPDKTDVKVESGNQFLLVPVKVESPKRTSRGSDKAEEDLDVMDSNKPRRIYIEPPDPDEDDDIRFVSSRIDDFDDKADTYRQLDEAVIADTSSHPSRSGKHVRYEDDRYEDRSHSVAAPTPVRGVPLPAGPKTDPADELDLSREEEYQNSLKERVRETERHVSEMEVPQLPLPDENNEEFARDSLDYNEDSYRQNRSNMARDSLELYDGLSARERERIQAVEKDSWNNPPPEPFSDQQSPYNYRQYGQDIVYAQDPAQMYPATVGPGFYGDSWQQTAYVQRGDAIERYDVVVEQQFIAPPIPVPGNYDHMYIHPSESQDDQNYTQEKFGVENPGQNVHSLQQGDSENKKIEKHGSQKQLALPEKPQYDYVSNNKYDYGRPPRRTYRQILDIKAEEKAKLETVFIKPKPKKHTASKLPVLNKQQHGEMHREREQELGRSPSNKAASAENLWQNRSAFLAEHKNGKPLPKKKLVKYPSESGISSRRPDEEKLSAEPPQDRVIALSAPLSPGRQPLVLKPITQEIVTEDGQKIIVDVKLQLSPVHGQPGDYAHNPHNQSPYAAGGPYGYPEIVDDRGNPAVQQYMPRQIGNNQYNPYIGYPPQDDMTRQGEFKENRDSMSPYTKIPPIPKSSENPSTQFDINLDDSAWQESESDVEGYAAQFKKSKQKAKEKPWYTIYNLEDYRRMQKEVRLGTLGPDLDNATYRERMEKKMRQEEYARQVKLKNMKNLANKKPPSFPRPKETNDIMNKRKVAVEYAKKVPKPSAKPRVTKYNSYELAAQTSPSPKGHSGKETVEFIDLDKLQQRHERDKQNVAIIRQNLGTDRAVSQNA